MKRLRGTLVLATVLLALAAGCGDDDENPVNPGGGTADLTINIVANAGANSYSPSNATITAGQRVAWHNSDAAAHTATADNGSFNTGSIAPGATSAAIQITNPGTFEYHCNFHPSMIDTLIVNP